MPLPRAAVQVQQAHLQPRHRLSPLACQPAAPALLPPPRLPLAPAAAQQLPRQAAHCPSLLVGLRPPPQQQQPLAPAPRPLGQDGAIPS